MAKRVVVASISGMLLCGAAAADHARFEFANVPGLGVEAMSMTWPRYINSQGELAGICGVSNTHAFMFSAGASIDLHPNTGTIASTIEDFNNFGQAVGQACIPPAGGRDGPCGLYLFRSTPGAPTQQLFPGAACVGIQYFTNLLINDTGTIAGTFSTTTGQGNAALTFNDWSGWINLSNLLPDPVNASIIDLNNWEMYLIQSGYNGPVYMFSSCTGAQLWLPAGYQATDLSDFGQVTGRAPNGHVFRFDGFGQPIDLDPQNRFPADMFSSGQESTRINNSGTIVGTWRDGFFMHNPQTGMVNLGSTLTPPTPDSVQFMHAAMLIGLNEQGEFTGAEFESYEPRPVIKLASHPLRRVQDVIDPHRERIIVRSVSPINDDGQFAVTGTLPGTASTQITLLVTPLPPCHADFNDDGAVGVQDIFDYLAAYFSNDARADMNGLTGITIQDLFVFLAEYFAGC